MPQKPPAAPPGGGRRQLLRQAEHFWLGLPRACRATLLFAALNAALMIAYGVVALAQPKGADEEVHITVIIVVSRVGARRSGGEVEEGVEGRGEAREAAGEWSGGARSGVWVSGEARRGAARR